MELLIVLMVPALVVSLVVVHAYARPARKGYSAAALAFMLVLAGITSSVHFVILAVGRPLAATGLAWGPQLLAFRWPSVAYALDILAWDWFFALAMLFAAPVFSAGGLERKVQLTLTASGVLSLAGLLGVPLANMQIRNVGILGYGVVAPVAFLLMGIVFRRAPAGAGAPSSTGQR